jgi:hypothetical protein
MRFEELIGFLRKIGEDYIKNNPPGKINNLFHSNHDAAKKLSTIMANVHDTEEMKEVLGKMSQRDFSLLSALLQIVSEIKKSKTLSVQIYDTLMRYEPYIPLLTEATTLKKDEMGLKATDDVNADVLRASLDYTLLHAANEMRNASKKSSNPSAK